LRGSPESKTEARMKSGRHYVVRAHHFAVFVLQNVATLHVRTPPIRATDRTAGPVSATAGSPAVYVDENFDGASDTVPAGVLVEGGGGNRDFDGDLAPPRGSDVVSIRTIPQPEPIPTNPD